jgi:hypothetical protein
MATRMSRFDMFLDSALRDRINIWRRQHPNLPSIAGALRMLAERALDLETGAADLAVQTAASARPDLPFPDERNQTEKALNAHIPKATHVQLKWYQDVRGITKKVAVNELLLAAIRRHATDIGAIRAPTKPTVEAETPASTD